MSTVNLAADTFSDTIEDNDIVLIDFWAQWCGPCRSFAPVYERVSAEFPDVVFAKVDTEEQQGLARTYRITSIPTLMAIRDKVVLYSRAGALPEAHLRDLVQQVRALDMNQVRAEIAAQNGG